MVFTPHHQTPQWLWVTVYCPAQHSCTTAPGTARSHLGNQPVDPWLTLQSELSFLGEKAEKPEVL